MIYFLEAIGLNRIKIGTSEDVLGRIKTLQCASLAKLELLCVTKGGLAEEREIHSALWAYRVSGEWFDAVKVKENFWKLKVEKVDLENLDKAPRERPMSKKARQAAERVLATRASVADCLRLAIEWTAKTTTPGKRPAWYTEAVRLLGRR